MSGEKPFGTAIRAVMVEWEDSVQINPSWQWRDEMDCPSVAGCCSIGWVMEEDHRQLSLAVSISTGESGRQQVAGVITIPKRSILRISPLDVTSSSALASACPDAA